MPNKHDFIGSSHLTNAAAAVLILWENKVKSAKRNNGEEVDDDDPDFILSVAKTDLALTRAPSGCTSTRKQDCSATTGRGSTSQSTPRTHVPRTPTQPSIELAKASAPVTSLEKKMPESLPEQDSMMLTDPFLSSTLHAR